MAMNIAADGDDDTISAINTTPLVDVMLVLLIIFLITVPVVVQSTPVELPKERNTPTQTKPENIVLVATKEGNIYWNLKKINDTNELLEGLKKVAVLKPQPEVHIRGDIKAPYEYVGRLVLACQRAGIQKIGFITEPPSLN
jgi:biopolymer transport protein ExbD